MAIKIREAERAVYMDAEEYLANSPYTRSQVGNDINKMEKARIKVMAALRKKIVKLAAKVSNNT